MGGEFQDEHLPDLAHLDSEREYQRLRKELEDKQKVHLDWVAWAQRFEVKSGGEWHPGHDGGS